MRVSFFSCSSQLSALTTYTNNYTVSKTVEERLKEGIVRDTLFNIIFGNLTASDVRFLLGLPGIPGLYLAVLYEITTNGFSSYSALSKKIRISVNPVREKVLMLLGGGLLSPSHNGSFHVPLKGRVFLELLGRVTLEMKQNNLTSELKYILNWLKLEPISSGNLYSLLELSLMYKHEQSGYGLAYALLTDIKAQTNQNGKIWSPQTEQDFLMRSTIANARRWPNQYALACLLETIHLVEQEWGMNFSEIHHKLDVWEKDDAILQEQDY